MRPVHYQEVRSDVFKLLLLYLFPFESLGAVTKKLCTLCRGVPYAVGAFRGITVLSDMTQAGDDSEGGAVHGRGRRRWQTSDLNEEIEGQGGYVYVGGCGCQEGY